MGSRLGAIAVALSLSSLAGISSAEDLSPTFHGFVSQGYLKSSDNNFLGASTKEGTFAYTEEALNFNLHPIDKLRVAGQFLGRDLGPAGNHKVNVDFFLGEYRWREWLGARIGRVKLPNGLYGTVMDADVARPEILQPQSLYPLTFRDFLLAFDGVDAFGNIPIAKAGEIQYEVFGGTMDIDGTDVVNRSVQRGAVAGLAGLKAAGIKNADYSMGAVDAKMKGLWGGALEWRPPVHGLRLRATGFTSVSDFAAQTTYTGSIGPASVVVSTHSATRYDQINTFYFSGEYERGNLRVSAEHYQAKIRLTNTITGLPFPGPPSTPSETKPIATYGQVAYRFNPWLQLSAYYANSYSDANDKDGLQFIAQKQPAHRRWLRDWCFTSRFDVNSHWLVKVEGHIFRGTSTVDTLDNPDGLIEKWNLFVAKTTVHF